MNKTVRISALVNTLNEADNIERCLRSLLWCDEILVVDMNSTDGTVEIAQSLAAKVILTDLPPGKVETARQAGIDACTGDWILILDADEVLPSEIIPILRQIANEEQWHVVKMLIRDVWWGKKLVHMGNNFVTRFFKSGALKYGGAIHGRGIVYDESKAYTMQANEQLAIAHYCIKSLDGIVERAVRYSRFEADWMTEHNVRYSIWRHLRSIAGQVYLYSVKYHFWQDGIRGLFALTFLMLHSHLNWVRLWEYQYHIPGDLNSRKDQIRA
jgi:glycosyltransferase involved in cell wall biosynthesis